MPATTSSRSPAGSARTSSWTGSRSRSRAMPSTSSGVYVDPPPTTVTFMRPLPVLDEPRRHDVSAPSAAYGLETFFSDPTSSYRLMRAHRNAVPSPEQRDRAGSGADDSHRPEHAEQRPVPVRLGEPASCGTCQQPSAAEG